ncbi:MAG: c-type cytochrome [Saprospiraceae bacterium]
MNNTSTFFLGLVFCFTMVSASGQVEIPKVINDLLIKNTCYTCHKSGAKLVGPSWEDIAAKMMKKADIIANIKNPDPKNWPKFPPMAPMPQVPQKELEKIADWIVKIQPKGK